MQLINSRVAGSSLMEVLVGMVIISLAIALTGTLFGQVFDSSNSVEKQKLWYELNQWRNDILLNNNIESIEISKPPYTFVKKAIVIDDNKGLWLINLSGLKEELSQENEVNIDEIMSIRFYLEHTPNDKGNNY